MLRAKASIGEKKIVMPRPLSPYDALILEMVEQKNGFYNAHAHLDRADTLPDIYLSHINTTPLEASFYPLKVKQNLTGDLHRGKAYTEEDMKERISKVIERSIAYGTTGIATCVDTSPDLGENGLLAFRVTRELKQEFSGQIEIRLAPNPIFGFKEHSGRWEVFNEAAMQADFLSALPEKDEYNNMSPKDGKIGYRPHLKKVIELGCELQKEVHLHLDQTNSPSEQGTKTLIEALRWLDQPVIPNQTEPTIWIIHAISTSAYPEESFKKIIDGLLEHNIGIIVCPTAAISMRQLRPIKAPTHNSIARVLELIKSKVPVLIGTDNICDVFVPQSDGDMLTEIKMLGHAIRFPTPHVLAKIAANERLNEVDRATVGQALYQDRKAFLEIDSSWQSAVD
ncbi:MAG: hypothetical protein ABIG90_01195 [bacterium]